MQREFKQIEGYTFLREMLDSITDYQTPASQTFLRFFVYVALLVSLLAVLEMLDSITDYQTPASQIFLRFFVYVPILLLVSLLALLVQEYNYWHLLRRVPAKSFCYLCVRP